MKLNFEQATIEKAAHQAAVAEASEALQRFPRGAMGLVPDAVKATSEYRGAKRAYDIAFREMQKFNVFYTKTFKAEYAAARAALRNAVNRAIAEGAPVYENQEAVKKAD